MQETRVHLTEGQLPSAARSVTDGGCFCTSYDEQMTKGSSIELNILNAYVSLVQGKFQHSRIVIVFDGCFGGSIGCADVDCNITDVVADDENEYFLDEDLYFVDE